MTILEKIASRVLDVRRCVYFFGIGITHTPAAADRQTGERPMNHEITLADLESSRDRIKALHDAAPTESQEEADLALALACVKETIRKFPTA
jgi:hypothetical protein